MAAVTDGCIGDGGKVPVDVTVVSPEGMFALYGSIVSLIVIVDVDTKIVDGSSARVELWVDV